MVGLAAAPGLHEVAGATRGAAATAAATGGYMLILIKSCELRSTTFCFLALRLGVAFNGT